MCQPAHRSANTQLYLIVGLGNPGRRYACNRHNVGFQTVDHLARQHGLAFARRKGKAKVAEGTVASRRVMLVKPQTYMNLSGESVASLARFFRVPSEHVLVIYDDLDLPLARLRLRPEGGPGGHKGLKSIIERLGTQAFPRLRVGIGRPLRGDPVDYVLQDFAADEWSEVEVALDRAVAAVEHWLTYGVDSAMNVFNTDAQTRFRKSSETSEIYDV